MRAGAWPDPETGSPPRAWGALPGRRGVDGPPRLTPTGVGSTRLPSGDAGVAAAHPHGRGEHEILAGNAMAGPRLTPTGVGSTAARRAAPRRAAARPHGRGEHLPWSLSSSMNGGSPPRAWGALKLHPEPGHPRRLTPTGVGSTTSASTWRRCSAAHPHGRGEHSVAMVDHYEDAGSPPRAWGAPHPQPADLGEPRLTPTGVGSTGWKAAGTTTTPAHPHGRGEHRAMPPETSRCRGSPPRAWGARSRPRSTGAPEEAHPHGRGEHTATSRSPTEPIGSPPRAWGAHDLRVAIGVERRLTPTGVGSTSASWWHPSTAPAHPHGRGEHSTSTAIGARDSGSPPRAWGAQAQLGGSEQEPRLTPTGVGSTGHRAGPAIAPSAHPHGRGEHCRRTVRVSTVHGSPPRAWGAHLQGVCAGRQGRLTPTGVGSTAALAVARGSRAAHPHGRGEHSRCSGPQ